MIRAQALKLLTFGESSMTHHIPSLAHGFESWENSRATELGPTHSDSQQDLDFTIRDPLRVKISEPERDEVPSLREDALYHTVSLMLPLRLSHRWVGIWAMTVFFGPLRRESNWTPLSPPVPSVASYGSGSPVAAVVEAPSAL